MNNSNLKTALHVGCPNIGDRELFDKLVDEIFERRWFTNSGVVEKEFETKLCEYLGVKHCIPVCNATVGLQLACQALELTGEVIVPAFTFVATPHAVRWEGLDVVFADVDLETHTICLKSVETLISDRTSAIIGVHVWGQPCQTDALQALAEKHDIHVMYDAAHAFGCQHQGKMIGNFGECEVFSFHATKFFNTFEGGAIATNDDNLAHKLRLMKNFGFAGKDQVIHLGTNAKMSEISAAMGLASFAKVDEFVRTNKRNYDRYFDRLNCVDGLTVFDYSQLEKSNFQYVLVEIDPKLTGVNRDSINEYLASKQIFARRYFYPGCHQMEPYASLYPNIGHRLPNTEQLAGRLMSLPNGTAVSLSEVDRVCDEILSLIPIVL